MSGGIYEGPSGQKLHGDGKPVGEPPVAGSAIADLEDMLYALENDRLLPKHKARCKNLADGMRQLLSEAFPPNAPDQRPGGETI